MKHWFKKSAAIAMSAVMALSLAACASSKPATPEEVLQAASEKVSAAKSMTCETTTQMKMSAGGQSIQMTMTGELETNMDPVAMHMDMTTDMGAMGSMNVKMYMKEENGAYSLYTGMDDGSGNITWTAQTMENVDQLKQYDTQATMELYLSTGSSFQEAGTETVEGKEAVRYDGVITNDSFNELFESTGILDQFSSLGVNEETAKSMLTDLGDLPLSIWVEKDSGLPVKYDMDMTAMMQSIMTKAMEAAGSTETITIETVHMTMLVHGIDNVESIEIPQEALDAAA